MKIKIEKAQKIASEHNMVVTWIAEGFVKIYHRGRCSYNVDDIITCLIEENPGIEIISASNIIEMNGYGMMASKIYLTVEGTRVFYREK